MLYEEIRGRNGIAIPHTSGNQGARANSEQFGAPLAPDPVKTADLNERAGYQPKGFVNNAWGKGYKLGIIASSDHGSTHISYAMVYTDTPTRQGVLDAIRKRHT